LATLELQLIGSQSQTTALDDRLYQSDGVQTAGGISLGGVNETGCRVQAKKLPKRS